MPRSPHSLLAPFCLSMCAAHAAAQVPTEIPYSKGALEEADARHLAWVDEAIAFRANDRGLLEALHSSAPATPTISND